MASGDLVRDQADPLSLGAHVHHQEANMNPTRTLWAWRAAVARLAAPDPRRLQRAVALERDLVARKPWSRRGQLCWGPFLPTWPSPCLLYTSEPTRPY